MSKVLVSTPICYYNISLWTELHQVWNKRKKEIREDFLALDVADRPIVPVGDRACFTLYGEANRKPEAVGRRSRRGNKQKLYAGKRLCFYRFPLRINTVLTCWFSNGRMFFPFSESADDEAGIVCSGRS